MSRLSHRARPGGADVARARWGTPERTRITDMLKFTNYASIWITRIDTLISGLLTLQ
jgi:hypothetical protein